MRARYGVDAARCAARRSSAPASSCRGELRPGGTEREWCDPEVLRRLRRASLAVLRKEIEAVDQRALAAFLPSWQGVDRHPPAGAGIDRLREVLVPLQGLALPADVWERDVLPRRVGAYSPTWMDQLCASRRGRVGRRRRAGRNTGRVALYFREDAGLLGPPGAQGVETPARAPSTTLLRERLAQSPCFFTDFLAELDLAPELMQEALWDLVWAGEVTNDAWAPLRAPRLTLAAGPHARAPRRARAGAASASRRTGAQAPVQGRWSLTAPLFDGADAADPGARRRTWAELLLERYGIVTREQVLAEGIPGGFSIALRLARQLETLGVAAAATSSRASAARSSRCPARSSACARSATPRRRRRSSSPPPTRRSPTARRCPGPSATTRSAAGRARRAAPTSSSPAPSRCSTSSAAARGSQPRRPTTTRASAPRSRRWPTTCARGRMKRLDLEKVDGEPVVGSALEPLLIELGFRLGPRKLTLTA